MTGYERYKQLRKLTPPTGTVIESRRKKQRKVQDKEFKKERERYMH